MKYFKLILFLCMLIFALSCGQQNRYISYHVKQGETIQSIAIKLDVDKQDLLRLNPDVIKDIKVNQTIIIPNKREKKLLNKAYTNDTISNPIISNTIEDADKQYIKNLKKHFILHKIKKGNSIYSLTHFYNVSQQDLYDLNPGLKKEDLKIGSYVKIKPIKNEDTQKKDIINKRYQDFIHENITLKVAMLLPFRASEYDTVSAYTTFKKNRLVNMVTDFYMGSKIAVDSLKKQGVNINIQVFDTGKRESKIDSILNQDNLNDADVIIGPFYSEKAQIVADKVNIPVIFPHFSNEQQYFSSSNLIKTAPEKSAYQKELMSYLIKNYTNQTIIIIGDGNPNSNTKINQITNILQQHGLLEKIHVLKPEKGYIEKEHFTSIFKSKTINNWVILATDDITVITDAVNSLISLPEKTAVTLFALNKAKAFDKIDNNILSKINFTYVTDKFIDETNDAIKIFEDKYRIENGALPSNYAIKGFDITYDILVRLASGEYLKDTFYKGISYRLVGKFDYQTKLFNSTINNGLFIVKYNSNLSLERLK